MVMAVPVEAGEPGRQVSCSIILRKLCFIDDGDCRWMVVESIWPFRYSRIWVRHHAVRRKRCACDGRHVLREQDN